VHLVCGLAQCRGGAQSNLCSRDVTARGRVTAEPVTHDVDEQRGDLAGPANRSGCRSASRRRACRASA
jgi:hypothetical protein